MRSEFRKLLTYIVFCVLAAATAAAQETVSSSAESGASAPGPASEGASLLDEITHPVSWATWGFDSRSRWEFSENAYTLQEGSDSEHSYLRLRNRIWTELTSVTNLTVSARLMTEPRYYFKPDSKEGWGDQEGLFDQAYIQAKGLMSDTLAVKLGRQEISFGDKWIFFDGTSADGSRTEFFDAARLTLSSRNRKTTADLMGLFVNAESDLVLPVINDRNDPLSEQDERAGAVYVSNEFSPAIRLDGHYIYRHMEAQSGNGDSGNLHVPGVRVSGKMGSRWDYLAEAAGEFGEKNGADLTGWGLNSDLGYALGGSWKHRVHVGYEFLSGDDPDTARDEGWDPMWGRRARWSELMVLTFGLEADAKRGYFSNLQRPNIGWSASPVKRIELTVHYMPMFANSNPQAGNPVFSEDGRFRGHLLQTIARFTLSKHVTGLIWNEVFKPGDFYSPSNRATADFLRVEINLSF